MSFASTSKSGIVPAKAPKSIALLPILFPKTASPTAAPSTIWVNESTVQFYEQELYFAKSNGKDFEITDEKILGSELYILDLSNNFTQLLNLI